MSPPELKLNTIYEGTLVLGIQNNFLATGAIIGKVFWLPFSHVKESTLGFAAGMSLYFISSSAAYFKGQTAISTLVTSKSDKAFPFVFSTI